MGESYHLIPGTTATSGISLTEDLATDTACAVQVLCQATRWQRIISVHTHRKVSGRSQVLTYRVKQAQSSRLT